MRKQLYLLFFLFPLQVLAQQKVTIVGELRMGHNYKESQKLPYLQNNLTVSLKYQAKNNGATTNLETEQLRPKERYYPEPGTEIVFNVPRELYYKMSNSSFTIQGVFKYTSKNLNLPDSCNVFLDVPINNSQPYSKNTADITVKLDNPILLNAPERLTLSVMIDYITEKLETSSSKNEGYSDILRKLDKYLEDYYGDKKISYETMIDFYKLLVFLDDYVKENSFFNSEASKLNEQISSLNSSLSDTSKIYSDNFNKTEATNELISSNRVYQEYLKTYAKIKDYHSRIQLILFLKTK